MSIADGEKIVIKFTQPLIGNVLGLDPPVTSDVVKADLSEAVVTTLNQYSSSYPGSNIIDGRTDTYWRGTTSSNWIQLQLEDAKIVQKLRLYMGSYYISSFKFYGSNDGSVWTQLGGTYSGASSTTGQWYSYTIENESAYLYYKLETVSGYSSSRIYLYELEMYEKVPAGNEMLFTVSFDEYEYVPGGKLLSETRRVVAIEQYPRVNMELDLTSGNTTNVCMKDGVIMLEEVSDDE